MGRDPFYGILPEWKPKAFWKRRAFRFSTYCVLQAVFMMVLVLTTSHGQLSDIEPYDIAL
jgi:hypothetical protein